MVHPRSGNPSTLSSAKVRAKKANRHLCGLAGLEAQAMEMGARRIVFDALDVVLALLPDSEVATNQPAHAVSATLGDRHEIEIVDVFKEPKRVLTNAVFITPTLVKLAPLPVRTIVGTLSQTQPVMQALGLDAVAS